MAVTDMSMIAQKIQIALDRLDRAIEETKPIAVYGLFSGGHDSFSATYIASLHPQFTSAIHIHTGIGIRATYDFVRETCKKRRWPLKVYHATENRNGRGELDPQVYRDLVLKHGFPGPYGHGMMYQRLKERALRRVQRDAGASCRGKVKLRVMYVSGCRSQESIRRMANTEEIQIDGQRIWCAPIHDWSKLDTTYCLEFTHQERNPVVDLIHKSGECLCGAYAKPGELEELNLWDLTRPAYKKIKALEALVIPKFGWGWEGRPGRERKTKLKPGVLCQSCEKRGEESEE